MLKRFFLTTLNRMTLFMLIPILILGLAVNLFLNRSMRGQMDAQNEAVITQASGACNLAFQIFDSVEVFVSANYQMVTALKHFAGGQGVTLTDLNTLNNLHHSILSIIAACPYIDSADIYVSGMDKYYSSGAKIASIADTAEGQWLASLTPQPLPTMMRRTIPARFAMEQNKEVISFVRSAFSGMMTTSGLVVMNIDLKKLRETLYAVLPNAGQQVFLISGDAVVALSGEDNADRDVIGTLLHAGDGVRECLWNGVQARVSVRELSRYGWNFVAVTPLDALYAVQRQALRFLALLVALCVALIVLLSAFSARSNLKKVRAVVEAVETVANGGQITSAALSRDVFGYIIREIGRTGLHSEMMRMQINEKRYQMELLEARALQYQINPHFQINTLRAIYWKVVENEGMASDAACMVENMMDFMGYVLSDPHKLATMEEEIRHSQSFCELLEIRHRGDVRFQWDVAAECLEALCCRLILEPYLENAYVHGLRGLEGRSRVEIRVRRQGADVVITVADDGRGMPPEKLARLRQALARGGTEAESIGLYNAHRRMTLRYGEGYGVSIDAAKGEGTTVTLRFPFQAEKKAERKRKVDY